MPGEVFRCHVVDILEAIPAVRRQQVRRALRHGEERREGAADDHATGGVHPRRVVRRPIGRALRQQSDDGGDDGDTSGAAGIPTGQQGLRDVLRIPHDHQITFYGKIGGVKEHPVGEAEDARVIEDGHVLVIHAQPLRVLERDGDAVVAGGGVGVAAAEREAVDDVRGGAEGVLDEEGWCGGGALGENRG